METEQITKNTTISDAIRINPNAANVFMEYGMHCIGCALAHNETIEQACAGHGIENIDELVDALNEN